MRLGTRRSALALAQAELVSRALGGCELVPITTGGDRGAPASDKSRWVAELEQALLDGDIDLAVHSAKDLPSELADGLELLGSPERSAPEDVLCGARALDELPAGARVGTSSVRRVAQLRAAREDLEIAELHGNVDTRLAKLVGANESPVSETSSASSHVRLDAIVLARAGLRRLAREESAGGSLDPAQFVPAPGQGTLALQGRSDNEPAARAAREITHRPTLVCLHAERELARELVADCHTPLGAWGHHDAEGRLCLRAWIGLPDGSVWVRDELCDTRHEPASAESDAQQLEAARELARALATRLRAAGAGELLSRARDMAAL
jgi:hydroxymethylbilane synthase